VHGFTAAAASSWKPKQLQWKVLSGFANIFSAVGTNMLANLTFVKKAFFQCSGGSFAAELQTGQDDEVQQLQPAQQAASAGLFYHAASALPCHGSLCRT